MLNKPTFNDILARVRATVPVRPEMPNLKYYSAAAWDEYYEKRDAYNDWLKRQLGWRRANGSDVGFPSYSGGRRHGERAMHRSFYERHLRTVPEWCKELNGAVRRPGRDYSRFWNEDPFKPEFMMIEPAPDLPVVNNQPLSNALGRHIVVYALRHDVSLKPKPVPPAPRPPSGTLFEVVAARMRAAGRIYVAPRPKPARVPRWYDVAREIASGMPMRVA